jgi:hypothetical protein
MESRVVSLRQAQTDNIKIQLPTSNFQHPASSFQLPTYITSDASDVTHYARNELIVIGEKLIVIGYQLMGNLSITNQIIPQQLPTKFKNMD